MTDRDRLREIFKKIEYTPFPEMTLKANLGNQFTDYALNCIVDELLANGVIVPQRKMGRLDFVIDYDAKELTHFIKFSRGRLEIALCKRL